MHEFSGEERMVIFYEPNSLVRASPSPPAPLPEAGRGELKGQ